MNETVVVDNRTGSHVRGTWEKESKRVFHEIRITFLKREIPIVAPTTVGMNRN